MPSTASVRYPFTPRSTRSLEPGQFWAVPLRDGRYGCGRVLQLRREGGKLDTRVFLCGLMDWAGAAPPTAESLAGRAVLAQGLAHLKTIQETGGAVLGHRSLEADGFEQSLFRDAHAGGLVLRGCEPLREATPSDAFPVLATWGFGVLQVRAHEHLCGEPLSPRS